MKLRQAIYLGNHPKCVAVSVFHHPNLLVSLRNVVMMHLLGIQKRVLWHGLFLLAQSTNFKRIPVNQDLIRAK